MLHLNYFHVDITDILAFISLAQDKSVCMGIIRPLLLFPEVMGYTDPVIIY